MAERPMSEIASALAPASHERRSSLAAALRQNLRGLAVILSYPSGAAGLVVVLLFIAVAALAPLIAPYAAFEVVYNADHSVVRLSPPSWQNWFGTTNQGMDVFSQLVWGSRVALIVGLLAAVGSAA